MKLKYMLNESSIANLQPSNLQSRLKGLKPREKEAYEVLKQANSWSIKALMDYLNWPNSSVYAVMNRLIKKGVAVHVGKGAFSAWQSEIALTPSLENMVKRRELLPRPVEPIVEPPKPTPLPEPTVDFAKEYVELANKAMAIIAQFAKKDE